MLRVPTVCLLALLAAGSACGLATASRADPVVRGLAFGSETVGGHPFGFSPPAPIAKQSSPRRDGGYCRSKQPDSSGAVRVVPVRSSTAAQA